MHFKIFFTALIERGVATSFRLETPVDLDRRQLNEDAMFLFEEDGEYVI